MHHVMDVFTERACPPDPMSVVVQHVPYIDDEQEPSDDDGHAEVEDVVQRVGDRGQIYVHLTGWIEGRSEQVEDAQLYTYPGYFRDPHWKSMGLPEISWVTWHLSILVSGNYCKSLPTPYLSRLPWIFPGAPLKIKIGLPEISRVTWQLCDGVSGVNMYLRTCVPAKCCRQSEPNSAVSQRLMSDMHMLMKLNLDRPVVRPVYSRIKTSYTKLNRWLSAWL